MRLPAILVCGLALLSAGRVDASAMMYAFFRDQVQASDFIVEGVVESQVEINKDHLLDGPFVYTRKSTVRVSKVYTGDIREGRTLTVLSHQTFVCDTSRLEQGRPYVLFLKRTEVGLVDVASGQGTYEIFDIGPKTQVAVNKFGSTRGGERIESLRANIAWALSGPASRPSEPSVSAEQAVKISRQAINETDMDLTKVEPTTIKLINVVYDVTGFACRGDPIWRVEWTKPQVSGRGDLSADSSLVGYVHARTGEFNSSLNILGRDRPSVEDVCRVFLATRHPHDHVSSNANEPMRIRPLSESEFRSYVPRLRKVFFEVRPKYVAGTEFIHVSVGSANPLIMVLEPPRDVSYAGEMAVH
jgi:hypothetical protein